MKKIINCLIIFGLILTSCDPLEDTYNELAELSEQAYNQYDEAFDAAVLKSREQYIADGWSRDEE